MTLLNLDFIKDFFTHNQSKESDTNENEYIELKKVPYRWTHGATDLTLGDGLLIYSIIHYMRAKVCVCFCLIRTNVETNHNMVKHNTHVLFSVKQSLRSYTPHTKVRENKCSDIIYSNSIDLIIYNQI